jgi:hypothetical protein
MKKFILLIIFLSSIIELNAKTPFTGIDDAFKVELISSVDPTIYIFPNPTNSDATLNISLPKTATVSYSVSNSLGQQIDAENLGTMKDGSYSIKLNATDYTNGIYFIKVRIGDSIITQKLIVK